MAGNARLSKFVADRRNEDMEDSDDYTDEEEYEEEFDAEEIVVWDMF